MVQQESEMKKINGKELRKKIKSKSVLVDVDSRDDYRQSHIANSVNVPYDDDQFTSKVLQAVPNRLDDVVVCSKPHKEKEAYMAAERLEEEGFNNLYTHTLGQKDWKKSGVEVVEFR